MNPYLIHFFHHSKKTFKIGVILIGFSYRPVMQLRDDGSFEHLDQCIERRFLQIYPAVLWGGIKSAMINMHPPKKFRFF